jgi:hypothetical protein
MSIQQLEQPNNLKLYMGNIIPSSINTNTVTTTTLNSVSVINAGTVTTSNVSCTNLNNATGTLNLQVGDAANVNIGTAIQLPTTGGTAASLDYYENYTIATTATGPWASAQNTTLYISRIGALCSCVLTGINAAATTSSVITVTATVPTRLLPIVSGTTSVISGISNSLGVSGSITVLAGVITIYSGPAGGSFASTGNAGFQTINMTWTA